MPKYLRWTILTITISTTLSGLNYAQVTADFSANMTNGCAPLFIQFQDLSTTTADSIVAWSWDLGGTSASTQNPAKGFTSGGSFDICLTVTDNQGNSDTECKTSYINLFDSPTALIGATPTSGCEPLDVQFTNNSFSGSGTINLIQWAFGDGGAASGSTPSHTYTAPGTYDVTLSVTDDNGCSDVLTQTGLITVDDAPSINFIANSTSFCSPPFDVNFTNLTMPPSGAYTYLWNFGDGNTSTLENPSHTYNTNGSFDVTLTVTNPANGCSGTRTKMGFIAVGSELEFSFNPTNGCTGVMVDFTDNTNGTTSNWTWDFGDGNTSTQQNPTHTYATPGCYFVTFSADADGCTSSKTSSTCIQIFESPTASYNIVGGNLACDVPHTVSFAGTSNNPNTWQWDFGDGVTSTSQNTTHTYTTFGIFPVTLTVISPQGCVTSVTTDTIKVEPITASFTVDTASGCSPVLVNFQDASVSPFPITSYDWTFESNGFLVNDTIPNPTLTFTDTLEYDITLQIVNSQGCMDTIVQPAFVKVGFPPNVDFSANDTVPCAGQDVIFTNTSDTFTDTWSWDFGDGETSLVQHPTHAYLDTGFHDVRLTATHHGCQNILEFTDYIYTQAALSDFSFSTICSNPFNIAFTNLSQGAHRYEWDFGVLNSIFDTSSQINPTFTYPARGNYTISLTAYNDTTGCAHTFQDVIIITDPIASFSITPESGCAPLTVSASNNTIDGTSFQWTIPGATIDNPNLLEPVITFDSAGYYNFFQLVVTDVNNCKDTILITDTVTVYDVYPDFSISSLAACKDNPTNFIDASSTFLGTVAGWHWDFGNGDTSILQNPTTTFTTSDSQFVTLTATSSLGCVRSVQDTFVITVPEVNFFTSDTFVCGFQNVQFIDTSPDTALTYLWDFGDGDTSTQQHPIHEYTTQGNYTVCLTVTDQLGCDSTYCRSNYITVTNPIANFTADSTNATCPILVTQFTDTSTNAVAWEWDFGDDIGTANVQNPTYTYVSSGSFDVTLVVTSPSGCTDTLTQQNLVNIDGPYGNFTTSSDSSCPNIPLQISGFAQNTARYIWDFGDGNFVVNENTDTIDIATHAYTSGGSFYPLLILEGSLGCIEIIPATSPIVIDDISVDIIASATEFCDSGTVSLQPVMASSLPIDSFIWDFGGIIPPSTDTFPVIHYSTPGIYTITLTAFNEDCPNFKTIEIRVGSQPTANFFAIPIIGCTPQLVNFRNTSVVNNSFMGDSVAQWLWSFGHNNATDTLPTTSYTYPDSGTYAIDLVVATTVGCFDTIASTVLVNLSPVADAGPNKTQCQNNSVQLEGAGDGTYLWSPAATLDCPTCPNPIASPDVTTTYYLTVTSSGGCTSTDSVVVSVLQQIALPITVSNDTTICEGDVIQLFASGGTDILQYSWDESRAGLSCYTNCNNPFASPVQTTTYVATLTTSQGCTSRDSITVTVINENQDIAGADRIICEGDSIQLITTVGVNPMWSPATNISCVFCFDPVVHPPQTSDYVVTTTTSGGCVITDTITIEVVTPSPVSAGADIGTCIGNPVQLSGIGTGIVSWAGDNTISDPTILNPTVAPAQTTDYILTINENGCIIYDTVSVILVAGAEVEGEDITVCSNESVELAVNGLAQNFTWTPTTGLDDPNARNPVATLTETTTYTILGEIPGCPSDQTTMTVNIIDISDIIDQPVQSVFAGTPTPIEIDIDPDNPDLSFNWSPNVGISCTDCATPLVTVSQDTTYYVQIIDSENGCVGLDSVTVSTVNNCTSDLIIVPNAFTPNGDGHNDVLYVRGSTVTEIFNFQVFSRSGELVFQTANMSFGWDGTHVGKSLNTGVYVYYVEAPCPLTGNIIRKTGNVTLLR